MPQSNTLPLFLAADAEDRIKSLGWDPELKVIVQYTQRMIPGLHAIEVYPCYLDDPFEPHLMIRAYRDCPDAKDDEMVEYEWNSCLQRFLPAEVAKWLVLALDYGIWDLSWLDKPIE